MAVIPSVFLGMDTDSRGSVALLDLRDPTQPYLDVYSIPFTVKVMSSGENRRSVDYRALVALMAELTRHADVAWLEEQWSRPDQGVASMFAFGTTFGDCRTSVAAGFHLNNRPQGEIRFVPGVSWKGSLGLDSDKKKAIKLASLLFPACQSAWRLGKYTSAAEAALIAFYGVGQARQRFPKGVPILPPPEPYAKSQKSLLIAG